MTFFPADANVEGPHGPSRGALRGLLALIAAAAVVTALAFLTVGDAHIAAEDILQTDLPAIQLAPLPTGRLIALAESRAYSHWGPTRCADHIRYAYISVSGRIVARARWSYAAGSPRSYLSCSITFNTRLIRAGFFLYCAAVVHEFGHLSGFYERGGPDGGRHSANPRNIMYPVITARNVPATCKRAT